MKMKKVCKQEDRTPKKATPALGGHHETNTLLCLKSKEGQNKKKSQYDTKR